jgi:hypothetical protein
MSNANPTWLDGFFTPSTNGTAGPITEGDVARTEVVDNYSRFSLIYVGAMTATHVVTFPGPSDGTNATSYVRSIFNNTTGGHILTISIGSGTTIDVAAGKTALLVFETTGVRRLTADV